MVPFYPLKKYLPYYVWAGHSFSKCLSDYEVYIIKTSTNLVEKFDEKYNTEHQWDWHPPNYEYGCRILVTHWEDSDFNYKTDAWTCLSRTAKGTFQSKPIYLEQFIARILEVQLLLRNYDEDDCPKEVGSLFHDNGLVSLREKVYKHYGV